MNRDILQTDLLDIIFENRNKEYGAYTLRKFYAARIIYAIIVMTLFSIAFSIWLMVKKDDHPAKTLIPVFTTPVHSFRAFHPYSGSPKAKVNRPLPKKRFFVNRGSYVPKIMPSLKINNLPSSNLSVSQSIIGSNAAVSAPLGPVRLVVSSGEAANAPGIGIHQGAEKNKPLESAEIMPQFPGGINALLAYLKKNIHPPEELNEDEEVSVKIKFVVNFAGQLEGFQVLQSGGSAFDNEVVRVLKKMPLWIPGKSNGENVSVYYVLPVRFESGF
jgi:periplasmic protein TonB